MFLRAIFRELNHDFVAISWGDPKLFLVLFLLLSGKLRTFAASIGEESEK